MKKYAYDIECYSNFFSIVFVDIDVPINIIDGYCKADYTDNEVLKFKLLEK